MKKSSFVIHTGKAFPELLIMMGYILIIIGVFSFSDSYIIGITTILIGLYLSFNISGFEINNGKYRDFIYLLFFKIGRWKTCNYNNISILKKRLRSRTYGGRTNVAVTDIRTYYEITLLSDSHQTKQKILRLKDLETAKNTCQRIADLLSLKITDYNPKFNVTVANKPS